MIDIEVTPTRQLEDMVAERADRVRQLKELAELRHAQVGKLEAIERETERLQKTDAREYEAEAAAAVELARRNAERLRDDLWDLGCEAAETGGVPAVAEGQRRKWRSGSLREFDVGPICWGKALIRESDDQCYMSSVDLIAERSTHLPVWEWAAHRDGIAIYRDGEQWHWVGSAVDEWRAVLDPSKEHTFLEREAST